MQPARLRFRCAGPLKERDPYREASPTEQGPAVKDRDPSFPQEPLHNVGPSQPTRRPKARLVRSLAERTAVQLRVPINEIYEHVKTQLFDLISRKGILTDNTRVSAPNRDFSTGLRAATDAPARQTLALGNRAPLLQTIGPAP